MIWSVQCKVSNCRFLDGGACAYSASLSLDADGKCETFKPHDRHISGYEKGFKEGYIAGYEKGWKRCEKALMGGIHRMGEWLQSTLKQELREERGHHEP